MGRYAIEPDFEISQEELKYRQGMTLSEKWQMTLGALMEWYTYNHDECYISFSGGKDSTVLVYITAQMISTRRCKCPLVLVFADTGLEYPEIRRFVKYYAQWLRDKFKIEVALKTVRPRMQYHEVISRYGYPIISKEVAKTIAQARKCIESGYTVNLASYRKMTGERTQENGEKSLFNLDKYAYLLEAPFKISHKCCDEMKKKPCNQIKLKKVTAMMADEGFLRKQKYMKHGCNAYGGSAPQSMPMGFWMEQDVLKFIVKHEIPICEVYGQITWAGADQMELYQTDRHYYCTGCARTGCMFCGFGSHLEKGKNRYQKMKRTHPKQYEYCIGGGEYQNGLWVPNKQGLGMGLVLDYIGVKY